MEATQWDLRSLVGLPGVLVALGVFLFVYLVPTAKLLRRTGHSPVWSLVALFPGLNLIALWIFAFKRWPTDGPR